MIFNHILVRQLESMMNCVVAALVTNECFDHVYTVSVGVGEQVTNVWSNQLPYFCAVGSTIRVPGF